MEKHRCINPGCDAHSLDMINELCDTCESKTNRWIIMLMSIEEKTEWEGKIRYAERMRIAKELREKPFGWCTVCSDIPCKCTI